VLVEDLTHHILEACNDVSNELGAGFVETVYEQAVFVALQARGFKVEKQKPITVYYRGQAVGLFFADLFVNDTVLVEVKALAALTPETLVEMHNQLKATGVDVGLIVNFGSNRVEFKRMNRDRKISTGNLRRRVGQEHPVEA
jgi:GxxExxY protein